MSILIKGMDMPTSCSACWALDDYGDYPRCRITEEQRGYTFPIREKRMDNCPLVPVPPHGRLIEDTAVREQIDEWLDSVGDVVVGHGLSYYGELLGCIEDAPTIIEAEEGE